MRNHELFIGEVVFDYDMYLIGEITKIENGKVWINQGKFTDFNKHCFDVEAEETPDSWVAKEESVYQIVKDKVDSREWGFICYEHNKTQDDYPYYSPILDENLFEIETEEISDRIFISDLWDTLVGNDCNMTIQMFRDRYITEDNAEVDCDTQTITIGDYRIKVEKIQK